MFKSFNPGIVSVLPLLSRLPLKVGSSTEVFLVAFGFGSNSVEGKALLFLNQKIASLLTFFPSSLSSALV